MAKKLEATKNGGVSRNDKKKNKAGVPTAVAMKQIRAPKPNPFETIWSRRNFDVIGKKRKGEEQRIGLARSIAIQKREKTLLKEYEQSGKSSVFIDKRIGEQNDELGEFDKAILRSQHERQLKLNKKSKYNLSDGEEDEFDNQNGLQGRDDFDDEEPFGEEDDEAPDTEKKSSILKRCTAALDVLKSGFIEGEENRRKTKKKVMKEIIFKSKYFKAEKAEEKEENEQLVDELDKSYTALVESGAFLSLPYPDNMNASVNKRVSSENVKEDIAIVPQNIDTPQQDKPDSYDKLVNGLKLDMRARPSDRTKTPEEMVQDEKERLEQLEEERQKRMLAADDSSDDNGNGYEVGDNAQRPKSISGDDLGNSFSLDEEKQTKRNWIQQILERKTDNDGGSEHGMSSEDPESDEDDGIEEGTDKDTDQDGKTNSLKDWEQSDDDNLGTDLEEEELGGEKEDGGYEERGRKHSKKGELIVPIHPEKTKGNGKMPSSQPGELSYVIAAPESPEELSALFENRSESQIVEAIKRIRTCNAISSAADLKKMLTFDGLLLRFSAVTANKRPSNFKLLNLLVKPLIEMSGEIPEYAAKCARDHLLQIQTQFCENVKNPDKSCWPSLETLFLLRLWSMIFPCSDFRHAVMTPAILLMCEYLMRCPILSGRDIAIGSFLCSMVLSVTKQSQKFCPEAIAFLYNLVVAAMNAKPVRIQDSQRWRNLMEIKTPTPLLCICTRVNEISPLDFFKLMDMPEDSPFFSSDNFRASILASVIGNLKGYVIAYEGFSSFPEIFSSISKLLPELAEQEHMPNALRANIRDVFQLIEKKVKEHHLDRRPLQMRKQKPVPIKLVNPKFEENFVKGRDYDPDRERAEMKKLEKRVRREAKGAARELRKDNYFLSGVKEKDKAQLEEERAEKYGRAKAFLQEQEHAFKSGQLGKGKKRSR